MATTKATTAKPKAQRKKKEPRSWYMDEAGIKIPLDEFFKDYPKPKTGPKRFDVFREQGRWPLVEEILDMRAVLK
ncbi:MAG: hypothetical protein LBT94_02520 [Prevotellaceae bacterium]|jgi:hypothetical protein|nr:hypothetical protein [Prevotellaceae bacterium]